ncbi:T9SS type A sorting domain-containing protein [Prevotella sp.]|uniref:T9SS type A sorting domain-containing protein n=1 Tax=Prevotella sp. TaxID=59823 RepID=UPI003F7D2BB1
MKIRNNNINRPAKSKRLLLQLFAMIALAAAPNCVYAQNLAFHQTGASGLPLDKHLGMQQTAEWHYYYYLPTGNTTKMALNLPFVGWTGQCNDLEPYGWIRWYDYSTDKKSNQLSAYNNYYTYLKNSKDNSSGTNIGLSAYKIASPSTNYQNYVGVYYNKPSGADAADWPGETIACDVSRYIDGTISKSGSTYYVTKEPTLTIRYIFHIRSAAYLANKIKTALCEGSAKEYADLTLEDNQRIVFGLKDDNATMTLRTNLNNSGGQSYWFYPLNNATNGKSVYATTENQKIKATDFQSTIKQAQYIRWIAYNEDRTKYCVLASKGNQFYDFKVNDLKNNTLGWRYVANNNNVSTPTDIGVGHTAYIVAYASDGTYMCPIANFELLLHSGYPKTKQELTDDNDLDRTLTYFDNRFEQKAEISFDNKNDLTRPTTANNTIKKPTGFKSSTYGFTYPALTDYYSKTSTSRQPNTPIHGDYGLYKSANLDGVSKFANGYKWWTNASPLPTIYDRTWAKTGGKQFGHFLYVDASDESRQIASADFEADLCTGSQLIFSGAVADYTQTNAAAPQVMFRLYGINKDADGNVTDQKLIQSFISGDFSTNTKTHQYGKWYQIFSKQVLQKSTGVSNYTTFRIVLDNMCKSTGGADYCIDDLCLYTQTSKLDVLQNRPLCPSESGNETAPENITFKLRGIYETFQAMVDMKESKLFYRICDENGNPVNGIDYDGDGQADQYGTARIPAKYDATLNLPAYSADGKTNVPMFENDNSGNRCLVIANRNFNLTPGKNYHVSIAYPSEDNADQPGPWGKSNDVCSTYSDPFQIVKQNIIVTDITSNVVTVVRVKCDGSETANLTLYAKLETVDKVNGGKVELPNVQFDWFFSESNCKNDINTNGVLEALHHFRDVYPSATTLRSASGAFTEADRTLLKQYIDNDRLLITANSTISKFNEFGRFEVAAIPIANTITVGGQQYDICTDPMMFPLTIVKDGPRIYTGFKDVTYPTESRSLRIGLPQIKAIIAKADGKLLVPMTRMEDAESVALENGGKVWISETNDPDMTLTSGQAQHIANVTTATIGKNDATIGIRFNDDAATRLREGYNYELNFSFNKIESSASATCPGEVFINLLVVPEYTTWMPSAATNAMWNHDTNWLRSSPDEICSASYDRYSGERTAAYLPMKFTKVTIPTLTDRIYPNLGEISYRTNGIANGYGNIAYDMITKWTDNTADHSDAGDGIFGCEKWKGNLCDQIYFKPEAELLFASHLTYNKAYVEKKLTPNTWSVMSSPLKQTYAGDLYVPANNGQEQSEAFKEMTYSESVNNRNAYPIYQRSWDGDVQQVVDNTTFYKANHDGQIEETTGNEITLNSAYWTHVYNKVDEAYAKGKAFAVKAGDKYTEGAKNNSFALIRLPKADTNYSYYDSQSNTNVSATVQKTADNYRMQLGDDANDHTMQLMQPLNQNVHEGNSYHLVGNPYPSSLSMYRFLKANTAFESSVWTFADGKFTAHAIDTSLDYDKKKDVIIPPTQAFFVKVKSAETVPDNVLFNASMLINRWVTGGEKALTPQPTIILTTSDGTRSSQSELRINAEASRDYVEGEDVDMLGEGNIAEIAQAYSVAGSQAVALNATDDINWMPIGVVAGKSRSTDVTVNLNSKMLRKMQDEGGKLFIYDATSKKFSEIADGMQIEMMANDHGRYYITTNNWVVPTGINAIRCFSPAQGTIIVAVLNGEVKQAKVYDTAGALVTSSRNSAGERCQLSVQQPGVYIVKATTTDDKTETFKIVVK